MRFNVNYVKKSTNDNRKSLKSHVTIDRIRKCTVIRIKSMITVGLISLAIYSIEFVCLIVNNVIARVLDQ